MYHVRTTITSSGATAAQVIRYDQRKRIVVKHIGSSHDKSEVESLKQMANEWIANATRQQPLFPQEMSNKARLVAVDKLRNIGVRYSFTQETLTKLFHLFNFSKLNTIFLDIVMMRIIQPASISESLELIFENFGIEHNRADFYRYLQTMSNCKNEVESNVMAVAKRYFSFNFEIVFYDVTTLYFESFKEDVESFRRQGFSKDNKNNQPQIVIGLIVTREGFPVAYEIFPGNTFEGKTFIPIISQFKERYGIKDLTVVADAAMISLENVEKLIESNVSYIVGARVANLTLNEIRKISDELSQKDGVSARIDTKRGLLVCDFSHKRYQKDKNEMEKQILKAEKLLKDKVIIKRSKFIKTTNDISQEINKDLIEKTKLLLGIKGYYTNMSGETDEVIIKHYHNLWHVEQAFRVAKSDLAMRPIYHFKKKYIEIHILMCFMALSVCKYIELQTGKSIKAIVKLLQKVIDVRLLNTLTNEELTIRSEINKETQDVIERLKLSH